MNQQIPANIQEAISSIIGNITTFVNTKLGKIPEIFKHNLESMLTSVILSIYLPILIVSIIILGIMFYLKLINITFFMIGIALVVVMLILTFIFTKLSISNSIKHIEKETEAVLSINMPNMF